VQSGAGYNIGFDLKASPPEREEAGLVGVLMVILSSEGRCPRRRDLSVVEWVLGGSYRVGFDFEASHPRGMG
jgi:hypothetical protein